MFPIYEYIPVIVRVMFALSFMIAAIMNVLHKDKKIGVIRERALPMPVMVFWIGFSMQMLGSLAILCNMHVRFGAMILAVFTVLASAIFHDFWNSEGDQYRLKMQGLASNISVLAGLLLLGYCQG